jgi:DNA transposition AAA+ family ATPase
MTTPPLPLSNVLKGTEQGARLLKLLALRLVSLLIVQGPAGCGKTRFWKNVAKAHDGIFLCACQSWATRARMRDAQSMLRDLLQALGGYTDGVFGVHQLYQEVKNRIEQSGILLICIDEADYLTVRLLDILRDLGDETGVGVICLSVTNLPALLATGVPYIETITTRMMRVEFSRPNLSDALLLARQIETISIHRDLAAFCLRASGGSVRVLTTIFEELENAAVNAGLQGALNLKKCLESGLDPIAALNDLMQAQAGTRSKPEQSGEERAVEDVVALARKAAMAA